MPQTLERGKEVAICGVGSFAPGYQRPGDSQPIGELIDKRARRRTSPFTKALADAYQGALEQSGFAADEVATVFGSALGEAATMISLLDQMFGNDHKPLSPMRFAMSVHNAAAGVVSTATHNRGFYTSLGADFDTPAMALFEAVGLVIAEQRPVIVVCGDEQAPTDLVAKDGVGWDLVAAAIAIAPVSAATPRLRGPFLLDEPKKTTSADLPTGSRQNPAAGLLQLVDAVSKCSSRSDAGSSDTGSSDTGSWLVPLDNGFGRGFAVEFFTA
jgi:hypothetical protein